MTKNLTNWVKNLSQTPQNQPIPGTTQVPNSGGGYSWAVDDWTRLDRFLILGFRGRHILHQGARAYPGERQGGHPLHRRRR